MDNRLSTSIYNCLWSLVKINRWLNKSSEIAFFLVLGTMTLPLLAKLGSVAVLLTGALLIGTLLYLVFQHTRQIEELQGTISRLCLIAMQREHDENMLEDD